MHISNAVKIIRDLLAKHDDPVTHNFQDCVAQQEGLDCCVDLKRSNYHIHERQDNPLRVALESLLESNVDVALARSDALNSAANTLEDNNYDAVTYLRSTAKEWLGIAERNKKTSSEEDKLVHDIGPRKTVHLYDENRELLGVFAIRSHIKNGDTITLSFPVHI